ncbi:MAG: hypothetical protein AB7O04_11240 [Hyphomonadaceae bacterium]
MADVEVRIENGAFTIVWNPIDSSELEHVDEYIRHSADIANVFAGVVGFHEGLHIKSLLDRVVEDGAGSLLGQGTPEMSKFCTSFGLSEIDKILAVIANDRPAAIALKDLVDSFGTHIFAPVYLARAVEGLRHAIARDVKGKNSWSIMRQTLNADEAYLKLITKCSEQLRHGEYASISPTTLWVITERSWNIMDRYIHFRLRDSTALTEPEFPMLRG